MLPTWPALLPDEQVAGILSGEVDLPLGDMVSDDGLRFMVLPGDFDSDDLQGWLDLRRGDSDEITTLSGMPVHVGRDRPPGAAGPAVLADRRLHPGGDHAADRLPADSGDAGVAGADRPHRGRAAVVHRRIGYPSALVTAVASSIVIGVGIDYAIHLVAAIDNARPDGDGYVLRAIDKAGRPIVANALGIAVAMTRAVAVAVQDPPADLDDHVGVDAHGRTRGPRGDPGPHRPSWPDRTRVSDHPLIRRLRELDLPRGDWALFGSGPLLLRGWIDEVGDLDIICRGAAWDRAREVGETRHPATRRGRDRQHRRRRHHHRHGRGGTATPRSMTSSTPPRRSTGIPCVLLEHIVAYKRIADRPKDRAHLAVIAERSSRAVLSQEPGTRHSGVSSVEPIR